MWPNSAHTYRHTIAKINAIKGDHLFILHLRNARPGRNKEALSVFQFSLYLPVPDFHQQWSQSVLVDDSSSIGIESRERTPDHVFGISPVHVLREQRHKHGKIHRAGGFPQHVLDIFVLLGPAQRVEHLRQVFSADDSISVLIDHIECFFKLMNLRLIKHCEHVGSCTLNLLLRSTFFRFRLPRRHFDRPRKSTKQILRARDETSTQFTARHTLMASKAEMNLKLAGVCYLCNFCRFDKGRLTFLVNGVVCENDTHISANVMNLSKKIFPRQKQDLNQACMQNLFSFLLQGICYFLCRYPTRIALRPSMHDHRCCYTLQQKQP